MLSSLKVARFSTVQSSLGFYIIMEQSIVNVVCVIPLFKDRIQRSIKSGDADLSTYSKFHPALSLLLCYSNGLFIEFIGTTPLRPPWSILGILASSLSTANAEFQEKRLTTFPLLETSVFS